MGLFVGVNTEPPVAEGQLVTTLTFDNPDAQAYSGRVGEIFGQGFARGDIPSGDRPQAHIGGSPVATQVEQTVTWPDGSLKFAVMFVASGDFSSSESKTVELRTGGSAPAGSNIALTDLPAGVLADATLDAETLDCSVTLMQSASVTPIWTGPHAALFVYRPSSVTNPSRKAAFHLYAYRDATSGAVDRVEYSGGIEAVDIRIADQTDHGTISNVLQRVRVGGSTVYSETTDSWQYTRWHRWEELPVIHVIHEHSYLDTTGLVLPIRSDFSVESGALTQYQSDTVNGYGYTPNDGINQTRGWRDDMSTGGSDEGDIGPFSAWDGCYRVAASGADGRDWRDNVWVRSEGGGRHQMHFWDDVENRHAQIGPNAGQHNTGNVNMNPEFDNTAGRWGTFPNSPWSGNGGVTTDVSHQPRFGYTQYLLFGRYFFLEEQQYWAAMCCGNGNGAYDSATVYNIWEWDQTRAGAWGTMSVVCAAVLTPDGDPMKSYFEDAMERNLTELWDNNYAPGQPGHNICGALVEEYPPERSAIAGGSVDGDIFSFSVDFNVIAHTFAWMAGYDGSGAGPDYSDTSLWLGRWPVGRVHKFGAQSAAVFVVLTAPTEDDGSNLPPIAWDTLRTHLYQYNTSTSLAFRGDFLSNEYNVGRNNATLTGQEPDSAAWRGGWSSMDTLESIGDGVEPGADQAVTVAALVCAVMRGVTAAQSALDKFEALEIATNNPTPTSTEDSAKSATAVGYPNYDLRTVSQFPHLERPLNNYLQTNITVGSTWTNADSGLGATLQIDNNAEFYSGGVLCGSKVVAMGGGHNSGLNDPVPVLDFFTFDTEGWVEEIRSTADVAGVADFPFGPIYDYIDNNNLYDANTPGGIIDERGRVALSRHTYDCIAALPSENGECPGFVMIDGVLPYDTELPPAGSTPWGYEKMKDIWVYRFGEGYRYAGQFRALADLGGQASPMAVLNEQDGLIYIIGTQTSLYAMNMFTYNPANDAISGDIAGPGGAGEESGGCYNIDDNEIVAGQGFGTDGNWQRFNVGTTTWSGDLGASFPNTPDVGPVPSITYVPARFGSDYGTYFALSPSNGTLHRRDPGTGNWSQIASGAPTNTHVYGRFGFEQNHQIFYYIPGNPWQTWLVRPYAHNPNQRFQ